jgi:hypothetical protein
LGQAGSARSIGVPTASGVAPLFLQTDDDYGMPETRRRALSLFASGVVIINRDLGTATGTGHWELRYLFVHKIELII